MTSHKRAELTRQIRSDVIRIAGHRDVDTVALSFAVVELLVHLYGKVVNFPTQEPNDLQRDRVILSDKSMVPTHYAVLAQNHFFAREHLWACGALGSVLQGVANDISTPGVDLPGGMPSLSLAAAWGMSKARALNSLPGQVWCIAGPVALQSELFWHSASFFAKQDIHHLSLLLCCVDSKDQGCRIDEMTEKMEALGWPVTCCDGHDFDAMDRLCMEEKRGQAILFSCQYGRGLPSLQSLSPKDWMTRERRESALAELNGATERVGDTWLL